MYSRKKQTSRNLIDKTTLNKGIKDLKICENFQNLFANILRAEIVEIMKTIRF